MFLCFLRRNGFVLRLSLLFPLVACRRSLSEEAPAPAVSAAPSPSAPAECTAGTHAEADGSCVADEDIKAVAPAASAAGSENSVKCPDPARPDQVANFDWTGAYGIAEVTASKIRGTTGTASETKAFAQRLGAELRAVCGKLTQELGQKPVAGGADDMCREAKDTLKKARAALGLAAKVTIMFHPPVCVRSPDVLAGCAHVCEPVMEGQPAAEAKCPGNAALGSCPGACEGVCEPTNGGACPGVCQGACAQGFRGSCPRGCRGSCDGRKEMNAEGTCSGVCEGACEGEGKGECKAACSGRCVVKGETCAGLCAGRCATPWKENACVSPRTIPTLRPACHAFCETRADRKALCTPGHAFVRVTGAQDNTASTKYEQAVAQNLPALLQVAEQLKGHGATVAGNERIVSAGVKEVTTGGDTQAIASLGPCLGPFFQAVTEGARRLQADQKAVQEVLAAARAK